MKLHIFMAVWFAILAIAQAALGHPIWVALDVVVTIFFGVTASMMAERSKP